MCSVVQFSSVRSVQFVQALHDHDRHRKVFSEVAGMKGDGAEVTLGGNTFHARAPATGNVRSPAGGRNHDVGTGGRTQSLARIDLGHEPEVLREVFRADTMKTAMQFEIHAFWH